MRSIILVLLLSTGAIAQTPVIDSLRNQLTKQPADTSRVNTLFELGVSYTRTGNDSLARQLLDSSIHLARRLKFSRGEIRARLLWVRIESEYLSNTKKAEAYLTEAGRLADSLHDLVLQGQVVFRRAQLYENIMSKVSESVALMHKALQMFRQAGDKHWESLTYNEMAIMKMGEGQYVECINLWLKARKIQEATQDWQGLRSTLPNLGVVYLKINHCNEALACLAEAEKVADHLHDDVIKLFILGRRGEILEKKGQYAQALQVYLQQAQRYEERHMTSQVARTYGYIGRLYIHFKQYDKALAYSQRSQQTYRNTVEASQEALEHTAQGNFGKIYLALKQYDRAIPYARTGLEWTETIPEMRPERTEYLRQLADAYDHLGQPTKALYYFKRYKAEADTMLNEEALQKATIASMTYDFDKKQQGVQLKQEQQETRIKSLENDKLIQTRNLLIMILLASAVVIGFIFWNNRRLRAKNEALFQKNAEIEAALYQGQTLERKRVASELHDSVASKVSALKWRFEAFDTSTFDVGQQHEHARLLNQMGEVYDDIRTISHNLMPEILEKQGLQAALIKLTDTLNVQNRTRFLIEVDESGEDVRGKTAYELYAITLELVNNILKHAKAKQADISLFRKLGFLTLTVQDDGQGIKRIGQQDGIGLQNIQARLDRLGGSYLISNREQGGTLVNVRIPIAAHA